MISLIHNELVIRHAWLTSQEFTDIVAVSQMTPGPIGINSATYAGYTAVQHAGFDGHLWGALGSVTATFALVLPSFILMLLISKFFLKNRKHPLVESVLGMLRPAVVGLLIAAALLLMNSENFGTYEADHFSFVVSVLIFVITFLAVKFYKASPILMIAIMGLVGFLVF